MVIENNLMGENIINELNLLLFNIPKNVTTLEKVRWLYVKVANVFSYNYHILNKPEIADYQIDFSKNYVGRYQTCMQISYLFDIMLNYIDGVKGKVIKREIDARGVAGANHVANEVILDTGEKLILDLTLDLYLVQAGCQTKHFGFETDIYSTYDIISLRECEAMDEKLGLIKNNGYTDTSIDELKKEISNRDYSNMSLEDEINFKIRRLSSIIPSFHGYNESKQFLDKLLIECTDLKFKEYNLNHITDTEMQMQTCYKFVKNDCEVWYLYDKKLGLLETTPEILEEMLGAGFTTRSNSLLEDLSNNKKKL